MIYLQQKRTTRALLLLILCALTFATLLCCTLGIAAQTATCPCGAPYENGFCVSCGAKESAPQNAGVYEISNAGQLYWFAELVSAKEPSATLSAKLTASITINKALLDEHGQVRANTNPRPWVPMGNDLTPVTNVTLDGNGYYISGLYANYDDNTNVGLFGNTRNVTVSDLGIKDSYFASYNGFVGGLIGHVQNGGRISYSYVQGTVTGGLQWGGLVGVLETDTEACTVTNCYTTATATFGIVGTNDIVVDCYYLVNSNNDNLDDGIDATEPFAAGELTDGTLRTLLSTSQKTWQDSCLDGTPTLRIEHVYEHPCTKVCLGCGDENRADVAAHDYSNKCDKDCNVCGDERTPEYQNHLALTNCDTVCHECHEQIPAATGHQYANACDPVCNNCFHERTASDHTYLSPCDKKCYTCGAPRQYTPHVFDNDCDEFCTCGANRTAPHVFENVCDAECNACGRKRTVEPHTFGEYVVTLAPTALKNGVQERSCTACGTKQTQPVARLGVALWIIILSGVGAGLVLVIGGFSLYWFVIKRRTFAEFLGRTPEQSKQTQKKAKKDKEKTEEQAPENDETK